MEVMVSEINEGVRVGKGNVHFGRGGV